jgi:hypothetical protein
MAALPLLSPVLKSIELPGGLKIELQDLEKARTEANRAGLLAPAGSEAKAPAYSFQLVAERDPNLALAGLRIEIEKRLGQLALSRQLEVGKASVGQLLRLLDGHGLLTSQERMVLADLIGLLNGAVHGATVDERAAQWAMDVGPRLLGALDAKIQAKK